MNNTQKSPYHHELHNVSRETTGSRSVDKGNLGESIAAEYLQRCGHVVVCRNYRKKFAEIDIITTKHSITHFVEVKAVSHETTQSLMQAVTHETWRPEELVHLHKIRQINKGIQAYLTENSGIENWQIDVITVRYVSRETYACVNYIENIS